MLTIILFQPVAASSTPDKGVKGNQKREKQRKTNTNLFPIDYGKASGRESDKISHEIIDQN